jgi:hypothetical protein
MAKRQTKLRLPEEAIKKLELAADSQGISYNYLCEKILEIAASQENLSLGSTSQLIVKLDQAVIALRTLEKAVEKSSTH